MAVQRLMERNSFDLCIRRGLILMGVGALMIFGAAVSQVFAWGGPSHSALATKVLDDPAVSPFISEFGIDANSVKSWTSEPPDAWHHPGWSMLQARGYLGVHNDMDWTSLSETTRLRYLIHIAADSGVPVGHSPARDVYVNTLGEAQLEGQVALWDSYPSVAWQTGYYHESTGYSETFTGTYSQILTKFYGACINNAQWYKNKENILGLHSSDTNRRAGWCGTTLGLYLARAMLVDYFLAKRDPVAVANGPYGVNPGGSVTLSSGGSQDPDSVTWNADGTYTNNGGGLVSFAWDLNNDGTYETSGANPTLSYNSLYALVGAGQKTIRLKVVDDEGKAGYGTATLTVYTNPTASGSATSSYMGKPGDVPTGYESNWLSGAASYDPDGGSIVSYGWDLNNDGVIDKTGSEVLVTYSDFAGLGVTAGESHRVTLTVTDNEGATATAQVLCPILTNPTCSLKPGYTIYEAHGVEDSVWNFDDGSTQGWYMGGGAGPNSSVAPYWDPISGSYCLQIHDPGYGVSPWAILEVNRTVQAGATLKFDLKHGVRTNEGYSYEGWVPQWHGHGNVEEIKVALIGPGGTQTLGSLTNVLGFIDASAWQAGNWYTYQMTLSDMGIAEGSLITQIVVYLKQAGYWAPTIVRLDNIEITHAVVGSMWNFDDGSVQGWYMGGGAGPNSSVSPYWDPILESYCLQIHDPGYGVSPWAILDVGGVVQSGATLSFYLKHGVRTDEGYSYEGWVPQWHGHGNVEEIKVALIGPGGTQTLGTLTNVLGFIDASAWNAGNWVIFEKTLAEMGIVEGARITQVVVYLKQAGHWSPTIVRIDNIEITHIDSLTIGATGSDPDGGTITQWLWDLNNDGVYGDFTGKTLNLTWSELLAYGLTPGLNTVNLKVVDDDGAITGGNWAGTATVTTTIMMVESTPLLAGDANRDHSVDVGDLGILAANYGCLNKTWIEGDFNGDGKVDVGDLGILAANYGTNAIGVDFHAEDAKVFVEASDQADDKMEEESVSSMCSGLGLPMIAGLFLAGFTGR